MHELPPVIPHPGATEVCVTDEEQLVGIMNAGLAQRAVTGVYVSAAFAHTQHSVMPLR